MWGMGKKGIELNKETKHTGSYFGAQSFRIHLKSSLRHEHLLLVFISDIFVLQIKATSAEVQLLFLFLLFFSGPSSLFHLFPSLPMKLKEDCWCQCCFKDGESVDLVKV